MLLAGLLAFAAAANAVPAYPRPIKVRQPDGSYITIQLHGDEFCNWATSEGLLVSKGADGWWRSCGPVSADKMSPDSDIKRRARAARIERDRTMRSAPASFAKGENRFMVILVEFADLPFTVPNAQQAFSDMLNKEGYSDNGGTGSVRDYYMENSLGAFKPIFDVYGPVTISGNYADYGGRSSSGSTTGYGASSDKNPKGIVEACDSLFKKGLVNFANYDNDHNKVVDNVFFFFAGHNEAEGGDPDTIWPHASSFTGVYSRTYNGISLGGYNCSSEYKGPSGQEMAGIGTFCHEFGHRLGLPDFYDVDYEENGYADDLMYFSLMSGGNYNNDGRTPPYLTAIERGLLGWMGAPAAITSAGKYSLDAVQTNAAYTTATPNPGEYFLYETRTGTGWDSQIKNLESDPPIEGMLIYHIDQSENRIDGITARQRWEDWDGINAYASHPCMYIKKANPKPKTYGDMLFPGPAGITEFSDITRPVARSWVGASTGYIVSDIAYSGSRTSFTVTVETRRIVLGTIRDSSGNPVEGASITVTNASSSEVKRLLSGKQMVSQLAIKRLGKYSVSADSNGKYEIVLDESEGNDLILTVSKPGYKTYTLNFEHNSGRVRRDVVLKRVEEPSEADLSKYQEISGYGINFGEDPVNATVAVKFTAEELEPYVGMKLSEIQCLFFCTNAELVDAFVDFGDERVCTHRVLRPGFITDKAKWTYADMSDEGVIIPADTDVYIGYALKGAVNTASSYGCYPIAIDTLTVENGGFAKYGYSTTGGGWSQIRVRRDPNSDDVWTCNAIISCTVEDNVSPFFAFGIQSIVNPKPEGYSVGDSFTFALKDIGIVPTSLVWYFDDAPQSASSIELTSAGRHKVKAVLSLEDGSTQEIEQEIEVK